MYWSLISYYVTEFLWSLPVVNLVVFLDSLFSNNGFCYATSEVFNWYFPPVNTNNKHIKNDKWQPWWDLSFFFKLSLVPSKYHGPFLVENTHWNCCPIVQKTLEKKTVLVTPLKSKFYFFNFRFSVTYLLATMMRNYGRSHGNTNQKDFWPRMGNSYLEPIKICESKSNFIHQTICIAICTCN